MNDLMIILTFLILLSATLGYLVHSNSTEKEPYVIAAMFFLVFIFGNILLPAMQEQMNWLELAFFAAIMFLAGLVNLFYGLGPAEQKASRQQEGTSEITRSTWTRFGLNMAGLFCLMPVVYYLLVAVAGNPDVIGQAIYLFLSLVLGVFIMSFVMVGMSYARSFVSQRRMKS